MHALQGHNHSYCTILKEKRFYIHNCKKIIKDLTKGQKTFKNTCIFVNEIDK